MAEDFLTNVCPKNCKDLKYRGLNYHRMKISLQLGVIICFSCTVYQLIQ